MKGCYRPVLGILVFVCAQVHAYDFYVWGPNYLYLNTNPPYYWTTPGDRSDPDLFSIDQTLHNWTVNGNGDPTAKPAPGDVVYMPFAADYTAQSGGHTIIYDDVLTSPLAGFTLENSDATNGPVVIQQYSGSAFNTVQFLLDSDTGRDSPDVVYEQYGGSFTQSSDQGHAFVLGHDADSNVAFELHGGTFYASDMDVGEGGTGAFYQSGGLLQSESLALGVDAGSHGLYAFSGGSVDVRNLSIGVHGTGELQITGGHLNLSDREMVAADGTVWTQYAHLSLGSGTGSTGIVDVSGNGWLSLNPNPVGSSSRQLFGTIEVGERGEGYFHQGGSSLVEAGHVIVGSGADGGYVLDAGTLEATELALGVFGYGQFIQNGGAVNLLALPSLVPGPLLDEHARGELRIGIRDQGTNSRYLLNAGDLSTYRTIVGESTDAQFIQRGGTHVATHAVEVNGAYGLYAGVLDAHASVVAGDFVQSGGTHHAGLTANPYLPDDPALLQVLGGGEYRMTGGTLEAARIDVERSGLFLLDGATASIQTAGAETIDGAFTHMAGSNVAVAGLDVGGVYTLGSGDAVLTAGQTTVSSLFQHWAGTHTVLGGLDLSGRYELSDGDLLVRFGTETIHDGGLFLQTGGSHRLTGDTGLILGTAGGLGGTYDLRGGTLAVTADSVIGRDNSGVFFHTGGTHTVYGDLVLGADAGGLGNYWMEGGNADVRGSTRVGGGGEGHLTHSGGTFQTHALEVGGTGHYELNGATAVLEGAFQTVDGEFIHRLGTNEFVGLDVSGRYDIQGGSLEQVGYGHLTIGGAGALRQSGGTVDVAFNHLIVGTSDPGQANYVLSDGLLLVNGDSRVGSSGAGRFEQTGGSHQVGGDLVVGVQADGLGHYALAGGSLQVAGNEVIGAQARGEFIPPFGLRITIGGIFAQTGGTHAVAGDLVVGAEAGSSGWFQLDGGSLEVGGALRVGELGEGFFTQTAVTLDLASLEVGRLGFYELNGADARAAAANATVDGLFVHTLGENRVGGGLVVGGEYDLADGLLAVGGGLSVRGGALLQQRGGRLQVSGRQALAVGVDDAGEAAFELAAGDLQVTAAGGSVVGETGRGAFLQTGGSHTVARTLTLAASTGSSGSYRLEGGALTANREVIGQSGVGSLVQTGGEHVVHGEILLGQNAGTSVLDRNAGSGELVLQGGHLSAGSIRRGEGHGRVRLEGGLMDVDTIYADPDAEGVGFDFIGGTLAVDSFYGDLVNQGGVLAPGDSPGTTHIVGDYDQWANGVFDVEIGWSSAGFLYDVLDVSGLASLGGTLRVNWYDFGLGLPTLALGDSFDVLFADTIVDAFDVLDLVELEGTLRWAVDYYLSDTERDFVRLRVVDANLGGGGGEGEDPLPAPTPLLLLVTGLLLMRRAGSPRRGSARRPLA